MKTCRNGHTRTGENTYLSIGKRQHIMCRDCRKAREKRRYDKDPEKVLTKDKNSKIARGWRVDPAIQRRYNLKTNYGISVDEYNEILEKQDGVCWICKDVCSSGRNLAVDHNHKTSEIRGLLCTACNQGLGCFRDSESLLETAASYLERD